MIDKSKLVRRGAHHALVRLGEARYEPLVQPWLGERFTLTAGKERDFVLDLESARARKPEGV